jgi:predicted RNase H-like HicB family nuclease
MSDKSKNSKGQAIDRPFDAAVLGKAKEIVADYEIVVAFEDGQWYGHGLELPGAHGDGKTPQAAVADTREAMIGVVAYMLEEGERPPEPARQGHRTVQINIRVTPEEKAVLESRSRAKGFRGLSDFIRTSVLVDK